MWGPVVVCVIGVAGSWTARSGLLPWAPTHALQGLSSRVGLPVLQVDGTDLYGRVGGGCLREWTEEGWAERTLPWVDGANGMAACEGRPATVAVAVPAEVTLGELDAWPEVRTLLWVVEWAPGELPSAFDAWRYAIVPTRWAGAGEVRRGPEPIRLGWTEQGWGVETEGGLAPIADKPFGEWLPDIQRGDLILVFHPDAPVGAVVDLCRAARQTKDALLGCTLERPGG